MFYEIICGVVQSEFKHDDPLDYYEDDSNTIGQPIYYGTIDSNTYGQWTADPDGENLTTCDNGLAVGMRRIKLPFNRIGQFVRFPSHHSVEFQVRCPMNKKRKFSIDFTSDSQYRQRFGYFAFQFKRYKISI